MATTTTNLGLTKPATSDKVDVLQLNGNFDILDSAVNGSQGAIAIMANGNTHAAIASGQFVYVRKHSSLSEGLYTATAAIAANGALSSSNLSTVSGGGLNALLGKIPEQLIHLGTETDYPLSAAHTAYPFGVTLIYTASSTSYPYGTGTVVTIRSANARCVQFSFGNSPDNYKLRTADSNGWSSWENHRQLIHVGTETDYPLETLPNSYPIGITLMYTSSTTSYPYAQGVVITIHPVANRCIQLSFANSPVMNYQLRNSSSNAWSTWRGLTDMAGLTDLQRAIGLVVNGKTTTSSVSLGQFVILKNSTISGCADGLYLAAKAIPANTGIDSSYLTAVSGGGLNSLTAMVSNLNTTAVSWDSNYTPTRSDIVTVYKKGQMCQFIIWNLSFANNITSDTIVGTVPAGYRPVEKTTFYGYNRRHELCWGWIGRDGGIRISLYPGELMYVSVTYLAA